MFENFFTTFDATMWLTVAAIVLLLLLSAFFSGSETALTAASRAKLKGMTDLKSKGTKKALELTNDNERLIGALLLGNNLVNILATSLATAALTVFFGDSGIAIATIIMTLLILIFAELMPKTYAITNPENAARAVAPIVALVVILLSPLVSFVRKIVQFLLILIGVKIDPKQHVLAMEEIAGAIELHHSEGFVKKEAKDRLLGALDLADRVVEEIMLHRSQIEMIDANSPPQEVLSKCLSSAYTRIPIFSDNPENVVGVIHAKDLLREVDRLSGSDMRSFKGLDKFNILDVAMKPYFIPETTSLDEQMRQFLKRKSHFALVVDEYGDLRGLITLEDILEEIVGQISDEHDITASEIISTSDGSLILEGNMSIRDINRAYDWGLPDNEANTLAGLVIHEAQLIPVVGQVFNFYNFRFEVIEREKNKITKIKIKQSQ